MPEILVLKDLIIKPPDSWANLVKYSRKLDQYLTASVGVGWYTYSEYKAILYMYPIYFFVFEDEELLTKFILDWGSDFLRTPDPLNPIESTLFDVATDSGRNLSIKANIIEKVKYRNAQKNRKNIHA